MLPAPALNGNIRQEHLQSCGTHITKINLDFYFQQMSQLVFVSHFLKIRSYLKCVSKRKLKSEIAMDGEEGFQDGHQEPGTCSSQREEVTPSGTDFVGEVCKPSHAELESGHPSSTGHGVCFQAVWLESEQTTAFHVLYILFIHFSNSEMMKAQVYGFPLHSILQICIFYKEYYAVSLLPLSHEITD